MLRAMAMSFRRSNEALAMEGKHYFSFFIYLFQFKGKKKTINLCMFEILRFITFVCMIVITLKKALSFYYLIFSGV